MNILNRFTPLSYAVMGVLFFVLLWTCCNDAPTNAVTTSGNTNPSVVSVPKKTAINIDAENVPQGYNVESLRDVIKYEPFNGEVTYDNVMKLINDPRVNNLDLNGDGVTDVVEPMLFDEGGVKGFDINYRDPNSNLNRIASVTFKSVGGNASMYIEGNPNYYQNASYYDNMSNFMSGYFLGRYLDYHYDYDYWHRYHVNPYYGGYSYRPSRVVPVYTWRQNRTDYSERMRTTTREYTVPRKVETEVHKETARKLSVLREQKTNTEKALVKIDAEKQSSNRNVFNTEKQNGGGRPSPKMSDDAQTGAQTSKHVDKVSGNAQGSSIRTGGFMETPKRTTEAPQVDRVNSSGNQGATESPKGGFMETPSRKSDNGGGFMSTPVRGGQTQPRSDVPSSYDARAKPQVKSEPSQSVGGRPSSPSSPAPISSKSPSGGRPSSSKPKT